VISFSGLDCVSPKTLSMLPTSEPKAIGPKRISYNVLLHPDGSTQEGAAFREPSMIVKHLASFSTVLSKARVGPVIAWGDVAMMFYGIPTCYTVNILANTALRRT
jgi:hypothetical protein